LSTISTSAPKRLYSFDLLRLFFVILALISHFRLSQGKGYFLSKVVRLDPNLLKLPYLVAITRSAMPVLLIIFGFMIEYVYAEAWELNGARTVLEKMLNRAVVCYLAFVSILFLVVFTFGDHSFFTFLGSSLFLYQGHPHANLFGYYTLFIPITFFLMWIRFKFNWKLEIMLVVGLITFAEVLKAFVPALPGIFDQLGQLFFGIGGDMGPSIVHSLFLLVYGALVANFIKKRKLDFKAWLLIILTILSFAAISYEISKIGLALFVVRIADYGAYRAENNYVYFAFGVSCFILFWGISWAIVRQIGNNLKSFISYYGGNTFLIFLYGNIMLLFIPKIDDESYLSILTLTNSLILSLAAVNVYDWAYNNLSIVKHYHYFIKTNIRRSLNFLSGASGTKVKLDQAPAPPEIPTVEIKKPEITI